MLILVCNTLQRRSAQFLEELHATSPSDVAGSSSFSSSQGSRNSASREDDDVPDFMSRLRRKK
jgi:hypothetical protein